MHNKDDEKKDNEESKKKDEGAKDYIKHVIDNPELVKNLKESGWPGGLPDTPHPEKKDKK